METTRNSNSYNLRPEGRPRVGVLGGREHLLTGNVRCGSPLTLHTHIIVRIQNTASCIYLYVLSAHLHEREKIIRCVEEKENLLDAGF